MQYFSDEYLEHHGIRGQKWGVRRFQNPDGSLTDKGKKRVKRLADYKYEEIQYLQGRTQQHMDKAQKKADKYYDKVNKATDARAATKAADKSEKYANKKLELMVNRDKAYDDIMGMSYKDMMREKRSSALISTGKNIARGFALFEVLAVTGAPAGVVPMTSAAEVRYNRRMKQAAKRK